MLNQSLANLSDQQYLLAVLSGQLPSKPSLQSSAITYNSSFSQYLRSVFAIPATKNTILSKTDTEKLFRKYYSKKVSSFYISRKLSPACSLGKWKIVKNLSTHSSLKKFNLRSLERLQIHYHEGDINNPKRKVNQWMLERIANCKTLKSLKVVPAAKGQAFEPVFYKQMRKLIHLESLILTANEVQIIANGKYILGIRSLRHLELTPSGASFKMTNEEAASEFYTVAISKRFEFLKLDLVRSIVKNIKYIDAILQKLADVSPSSFEVLLAVNSNSAQHLKYLHAATDHSDTLTLSSVHTGWLNFICNTIHNKGSEEKAKRKLKLGLIFGAGLVSDEDDSLSTTGTEGEKEMRAARALLANFMGLNIVPMRKLDSIKNVRTLCLDFEKLGKDLISFTLDAFKKSLQQLRLLENLVLNALSLPERDQYELVFEEVSKLLNLKILRLNNLDIIETLLPIVTRSILSLVNLEIFHLEIQSSKFLFEVSDFPLSFPEPSKLTDLHMKLPPLGKEARINVIEAISKLYNLRILKLVGGSQLFEDENHRTKLMQGLLGLKDLKEVYIIQDGAPEKKLLFPIQNDVEDARRLRDFAEKFFKENKSLQKLGFQKNHSYFIKYQRY